MNGSTDAPLVDRRLFLGLVFVIAVQGTVWFIAGLMWFGADGAAQDYLVIAFFGAYLLFRSRWAHSLLGWVQAWQFGSE